VNDENEGRLLDYPRDWWVCVVDSKTCEAEASSRREVGMSKITVEENRTD